MKMDDHWQSDIELGKREELLFVLVNFKEKIFQLCKG